MQTYFFDDRRIRYQLAASHPGIPYNWIFIPGGPGADSFLFNDLVKLLKPPGNSWLVDFPGNGSNTQGMASDYNFDDWFELLVPMVKRFENAVVIGHSFGGMFPLIFPELEKHAKGLVILNAAPCLWLQEAVEYSKQFELPDLSLEMTEFTLHPTQATFENALDACTPYYFHKDTLEMGRALVKQVPFNYLPAVWWQRKAVELNYTATWVPKIIPTLIISGTHDCICPYTLFQKDRRFQRPNIALRLIENAGHIPWLEKPEAVNAEFKGFLERLCNKALSKLEI